MSTTTPTTPLAPGPVAADPAAAFEAAAAAFLATWAGALDAIRPGDDCGEQIEGMTDHGVIRSLDGLGRVRHIIDVMAARLMGAVSERSRPVVGRVELTRQHGCANPTVLLAERWRIPRGQASAIASVGKAITPTRLITGELLETPFPEIGAAIEPTVGDDGASAAAPLTVEGAAAFLREVRVLPRVDADHLHAALEAGIEHAAYASLPDVAGLAKLVRTSLDQDGREPREARLREQQRCTLREHPDGMTELTAFLAPEAAAWVRSGIDALVGKQLRQVRFVDASPDAWSTPASERGFDDDFVPPADLPDTRTMEQRRADALVDVFRHAGGCSTAVTELAPVSLVVHIDLADLADDTRPGTASIEGVTEPITAGTARRMAADGRVIPMVLDGPSQVLDLGMGARLFTKAQKLALSVRDGGCAWSGCIHPPSLTEAHHLRWWSQGGRTDLDNGILLCSFHHHRIHDDRWEIVVRDGVPWFIPPWQVDVTRTPRRGGKPRLARRPVALPF